MPNNSRGITFTGPRTEIDGLAPCSHKSIAISPPEFPKPTTKTRWSLKDSPFRYWELCRIGPTNELCPGQVDQDSLPPYDVLDDILQAYVEERLDLEAIAARGHDRELARRVLRMVVQSEYKRRQAAPVLKVSEKAFGEGRRFPIAHGYRY